jgi:7-cyano-7-deazaguanine synthase in queuosine biosynthesis
MPMTRQKAAGHAKERTELLGVRVTAPLKTKVKVEAARRGLTVAQLFEEMWRCYLEQEHAGAR